MSLTEWRRSMNAILVFLKMTKRVKWSEDWKGTKHHTRMPERFYISGMWVSKSIHNTFYSIEGAQFCDPTSQKHVLQAIEAVKAFNKTAKKIGFCGFKP